MFDLFSKVATDGSCITTSGRLYHMSVDRGINEYFLWFRRILSLNIMCLCPLVWLPGPLGIFGIAFPVMILYNSIMSPLILRYANVGRGLVSLSLYSRSRKPGISFAAHF